MFYWQISNVNGAKVIKSNLCHFVFSAKVDAMKILKASKIQNLFFVLIILFNPISVSADAVFSKVLYTDDMLSGMDCHDDESTMLLTDSRSGQSDDCCEESCSCVESGCQSSSALIPDRSMMFYSSSTSTVFKKQHYSNINSSPSSPPPIV